MATLLTKVRRFERPWSLRRRLLRILLITLAALSLASAAFTFVVILHKAHRAADQSLERSAVLLLRFIEREYASGQRRFDALVGVTPTDLPDARISLWDARGRMLIGEESGRFQHGAGTPRFQDVADDGARWRAVTVWNEAHTLELQVAEPRPERFQGAAQLATLMVLALCVALPAAGLLIWGAVARAVSPVPLAAAHVALRGPDDLSEIPAEALPQELAPLVTSFNQLLARLATTLEQQRLFAANVAHELRTPLAAIRINAQLVQRGPDEVGRPALDKLIAGVDRMTRMIEQLLTLARLESGALGRIGPERFRLNRLIDETLAELEGLGRSRGVSLTRQADTAEVSAPFQASHMLLRNLVENALRYTQGGGVVQVSSGATPRGWYLDVADDGPGLGASQAAVLRGHAAPQRRADGSGSGLGLSIVRRLVELMEADIDVGPGLGGRGTRVRVDVPLASVTPSGAAPPDGRIRSAVEPA